jgi:hypothetical protein
VHWGKGRETLYYDECQRAFETVMTRPKKGLIYDVTDKERWMESLKVLLYGAYYVLVAWVPFPGRKPPAQTTVLVNAAQMHGNTGRLGNKVEVVVL